MNFCLIWIFPKCGVPDMLCQWRLEVFNLKFKWNARSSNALADLVARKTLAYGCPFFYDCCFDGSFPSEIIEILLFQRSLCVASVRGGYKQTLQKKKKQTLQKLLFAATDGSVFSVSIFYVFIFFLIVLFCCFCTEIFHQRQPRSSHSKKSIYSRNYNSFLSYNFSTSLILLKCGSHMLVY